MGERRRPEAEDLLQIAEHRRSMQALRRAADAAAKEAVEANRERSPVTDEDAPDEDVTLIDNVRSLAARRARRAGHPAGSNRRR